MKGLLGAVGSALRAYQCRELVEARNHVLDTMGGNIMHRDTRTSFGSFPNRVRLRPPACPLFRAELCDVSAVPERLDWGQELIESSAVVKDVAL